MKKWKVFCFLLLALLFVFGCTGCTTTKETIDLQDVVRPVLEQRPDNATLEVYATTDIWSTIHNMNTYFHAWEMWQGYAESLEDTIKVIEEKIGR